MAPIFVTRSTLAKLMLADPRVRSLRDLQPIAYLLTGGHRRLPLFDPEVVENLKNNNKTE